MQSKLIIPELKSCANVLIENTMAIAKINNFFIFSFFSFFAYSFRFSAYSLKSLVLYGFVKDNPINI
ncbi:MAG: hypothetical protein CVU05_03115 [Bacteroidetes bacterium HGW-Bacteroidetes-21]|nr:MAG: hypothetical protein CVU05_03115 [Bacteroidetes bacterium HGW-Bacteroidetes-21]